MSSTSVKSSSSSSISSISFTGFFLSIFKYILLFIVVGTTTGFDIIGFDSTSNNFSLVPFLPFLPVFPFVVLLISLPVGYTIFWYSGDVSLNTSFTLFGNTVIITFNCSCVYCDTIFLKLSAYFSSLFPNFLKCIKIFLISTSLTSLSFSFS